MFVLNVTKKHKRFIWKHLLANFKYCCALCCDEPVYSKKYTFLLNPILLSSYKAKGTSSKEKWKPPPERQNIEEAVSAVIMDLALADFQ